MSLPGNIDRDEVHHLDRTFYLVVDVHVRHNKRVPDFRSTEVADELYKMCIDIDKETGTEIRREYEVIDRLTRVDAEIAYRML